MCVCVYSFKNVFPPAAIGMLSHIYVTPLFHLELV